LILEPGSERARPSFFSTHILPHVRMTCDRGPSARRVLRNVGPLAMLLSARLCRRRSCCGRHRRLARLPLPAGRARSRRATATSGPSCPRTRRRSISARPRSSPSRRCCRWRRVRESLDGSVRSRGAGLMACNCRRGRRSDHRAQHLPRRRRATSAVHLLFVAISSSVSARARELSLNERCSYARPACSASIGSVADRDLRRRQPPVTKSSTSRPSRHSCPSRRRAGSSCWANGWACCPLALQDRIMGVLLRWSDRAGRRARLRYRQACGCC